MARTMTMYRFVIRPTKRAYRELVPNGLGYLDYLGSS
jgi:hypothetical protein